MGLTRRECPKSETPFEAQKVQSFIMKYAAMAVSRKNLETSDEKYPKKESLGTKKKHFPCQKHQTNLNENLLV